MPPQTHRNWHHIIFLISLPVVATIGTILLCLYSHILWQNWALAVVMYFASGFAITAGYHRLFAHKSYQAHWCIRLFFILLGSAAFQGSVLDWASDHRKHHRYNDTDKDPYNIKQGFWYAHILWLFSLDMSKRNLSDVDDLAQCPMLRFQHRYSTPLSIFMGLAVPALIGCFWGQPLAAVMIGGALRATVLQHCTFFINSLCHVLGRHSYSDKTSACDNWITAFLTLGEGYHNYHHQFPIDYRNATRFYQYDPTKWLIGTLSLFGLASNLRRIPKYRIIQARTEMQKKQLVKHPSQPRLEQLYQAIAHTATQIKLFEQSYAKHQQQACRLRLKQAKLEFKQQVSEWRRLIRQTLSHTQT